MERSQFLRTYGAPPPFGGDRYHHAEVRHGPNVIGGHDRSITASCRSDRDTELAPLVTNFA